jgi:hypothetical protein
MNRWRTARGLLLWLLAPAWFLAACGETERHVDEPNTAGQPTGGATAGRPPIGRAGGGVDNPPVVGGEPGVGGQPALPPGLSDMPSELKCGAETCTSAAVGPVYIDPCCATDGCGLVTGFLGLVGAAFEESCQARDQPGEADQACPTSSASSVPFDAGGQTIMIPIAGFAGCCRVDGVCGVIVNDVRSPVLGNLATLGLGCVDSAPFFPGAQPAECGAGSGGAGGFGGGGGGEASGGGGAGGFGGAG